MKKSYNQMIHGSKGKPITFDVEYKENGHAQPIVIFCHGFKGFKNWGHFDLLGEEFAKHHIVFVKFNFSHNGTTPEQQVDFADLDAFGENNYSIELDDLGLMIDHIQENAGLYSGDPSKIYLLGHSRGGGIAILKAHEDKRIKKLVTWASVKDAEDFFNAVDMEQWKKDGTLFTFNSRTQQNMPLHYQLYEDYIQHIDRLDIPKAAVDLTMPWLILHGTNDTSVPFFCAEQLHEWNPRSELMLIDNADHTFGGKHPWEEKTLPQDARSAVQKTIAFLKG